MSALESCQTGLAGYWSERLEYADPALAGLYRATWVQEHPVAGPVPQADADRARHWRWPWDGELWRDELGLVVGKGTCAPGAGATLFSGIDTELLDEALAPLVPAYRRLPEPGRRVARAYLAIRALRGSPVFAPLGNGCEDQAIRMLADSAAPASAWVSECSRGEKGLVAGALLARAGDQALSKREAQWARRHYASALRALSGHAIPAALWYRVGVAGALSGEPVDSVIRALQKARASRSLPEGAFATAGNLVCDRLGRLARRDLRRLFDRLFVEEDKLDSVADLVDGCSPGTRAGAWDSLLPGSRGRARARILGAWLETAHLETLDGGLARERRGRALDRAGELGRLARETLSAASAFWKALRGKTLDQAEKLVHAFRSKAPWGVEDDERWATIRARAARSQAAAEGAWLADSASRAPRVFRLPAAPELPSLDLGDGIELRLLETLREWVALR